MKDRVPIEILSNGAVRYAEYSSDEQFQQYRYFLNADGAIEPGTPLNKANLLSDLTADHVWEYDVENKPSNPTVNNAIDKLSQGVTNIGDVLITARTDLNSDWLLCNGNLLDQIEYQKLAEVSSMSLSEVVNVITTYGIKYLNGRIVIFGFKSGDKRTIYYFYNNEWKYVEDDALGIVTIRDMIYDGTRYIALWTAGDSVKVGYSTNIDGPYTVNTVLQSSSVSDNGYVARSIAYGNSIYAVAISTDISTDYVYTSSSISGTFTQKAQITGRSFCSPLVYKNGYFITTRGNCDLSGPNAQRLLYSSDCQSFSIVSFDAISPSVFCIGSVDYDGSNFIVFGRDSNGSPVIAYSSSLSGTWNSSTIINYVNPWVPGRSPTHQMVYGAYDANSETYYCWHSNGEDYTDASYIETFKSIGDTPETSKILFVVESNQIETGSGSNLPVHFSLLPYSTYPGLGLIDSSTDSFIYGKWIPSIAINSAYAYIKAL